MRAGATCRAVPLHARCEHVTRILVIDDDVTLAELMRVVLEDAEFTVAVATNPRDLPSGRFDCIITDLVTVGAYAAEDARDWLLRLSDRYPLVIRDIPKVIQTVSSRARHQDIFPDPKKTIETGPIIADNRRRARRCLEQAHARRVSGADHFGARDVQSEPLRSIEVAMLGR